jgi:hypothetical protein
VAPAPPVIAEQPAPPQAAPAEPVSAAPAPAAPEPSWARIEGDEAAVPPAVAPEPDVASADRAGGAGETIPATPLAGSSSPATGPARSHAGPEPEEPAPAQNGAPEIPVPSAARLVAIEMAVGGSSRAEVEQHLREKLGVTEPEPLLDDVFGVASTAGSRLAWGEP